MQLSTERSDTRSVSAADALSANTPTAATNRLRLRLGLPKGRMQAGVQALLADAGIECRSGARSYRPNLSAEGFETKLLKAQNIVEMLGRGSRDIGFAGADWVQELGADVVELLDTELDPVRVLAAAPPETAQPGSALESNSYLRNGQSGRKLIVASEYGQLAARWIAAKGLDASVLRTYGATEVFPPEDADIVVDNSQSGATLAANNLVVIDELMRSSTRLYASREAMADPQRRAAIENFQMLVGSVLEARKRVLIEINVSSANLEAVCSILPCMERPTLARLAGPSGSKSSSNDEEGFAVKAAIPRAALAQLIPAVKAQGGSDIVVVPLTQIVP